MKHKTKLISLLILIKENQQMETKKAIVNRKLNNPSVKDLLSVKTDFIEKRKDAKPADGYWILLQDWTSCSLKCGGGKSYQQWMCVPPKKGGRKCLGKSIRIRPCNTQPCPSVLVNNPNGIVKKSPLDSIKPSIIVSQPFSNRPQNFMKCVIKENDVFYIDPVTDRSKKIPSRIVLNTRSISLYTDMNFKDNVFSFNLKDTNFTPYRKDKCCFNLESGTQIFTICGGFGQKCGGGKETYSFFENWRNDFKLFKYGCYEEFKKESFLESKAKKAEDKLKEAAGLSIIEDRANLVKKKLVKKEMDVLAGKVTKTEALAMRAIKREFDIEKMITQEIQQKTMLETKLLLEKKKHEEKKRECLEQLFSAKKKESYRLRMLSFQNAQINSIKKDAEKQILIKRAKMRNKIKEILTKSLRRRKQIEGEIRKIRSVIANKLMTENRKGSSEICLKGMESKKNRLEYCKHRIVDSFIQYNECIQETTFGNICCENEFGNMHIEERDKCIAMLDKKLSKTLDEGQWTLE
jgi:hypothetical protein